MATPTGKKSNDIAEWPYVRWIKSRNRWLVDSRTNKGGGREYRKTKDEALGLRRSILNLQENEGAAAFDDQELSVYGWSVTDAIKFALDHLKKQASSCPLSEAVDSLVAFKKTKVEEDRLSDIENRLAKFVEAFLDRKIVSITPDEITEFLATISHPTTRNDYRKEIVMLWNYARPKGWVGVVLDKTSLPKDKEPEKSRAILTVDQAKKLMEASLDPEVRALNAMVLFGGVRVEEVMKLDWSAVNFKTKHIDISAEVSKVSSERFAPMPPNLRAWLLPVAKESGPIITRKVMNVPFRLTWQRAGLYPWIQDWHRHSFISYRRAIVGDAITALEGGTSEAIIKKHYKRPVLRKDAVAYSKIMPSGVNPPLSKKGKPDRGNTPCA